MCELLHTADDLLSGAGSGRKPSRATATPGPAIRSVWKLTLILISVMSRPRQVGCN